MQVSDVRRCQIYAGVRLTLVSNINHCQMYAGVRKCQMNAGVRKCQMYADASCIKLGSA